VVGCWGLGSQSLCTRNASRHNLLAPGRAILALDRPGSMATDDEKMNGSGKAGIAKLIAVQVLLASVLSTSLPIAVQAASKDHSQGESVVLPDGSIMHVPPAGVVFCNKHYRGGIKGVVNSKLEQKFWYAHTSMYRDRYSAAVEGFTDYLKLFAVPKERSVYKTKEMADFMLGRAYQGRGYCYLMERRYQAGVDDLNESIKYRPDYRESYLNRAQAYKLLGRKDLAERDAEQASHMKPHKLPDFIENAGVIPIQDTPLQSMPD